MPKRPKIPPTKWFRGRDPAKGDEYIVRLKQVRIRGAVQLEFHKESPTAPGRIYVVRRGRLGLFQFVQAAHTLLDMSRWDLTTDPTSCHARPMWYTAHPEYPLRRALMETVILHIDRLLNPRRGRPASTEVEALRGMQRRTRVGGVSSGYATARLNRRAEMRALARNLMNLIQPLLERLDDTRRMTGYTQLEVAELSHGLRTIRTHIVQFDDMVTDNKFSTEQPANTPVPADIRERIPVHRANVPRVIIGDLNFDDILTSTPIEAAPPPTRKPIDQTTYDQLVGNELPFPEGMTIADTVIRHTYAEIRALWAANRAAGL